MFRVDGHSKTGEAGRTDQFNACVGFNVHLRPVSAMDLMSWTRQTMTRRGTRQPMRRWAQLVADGACAPSATNCAHLRMGCLVTRRGMVRMVHDTRSIADAGCRIGVKAHACIKLICAPCLAYLAVSVDSEQVAPPRLKLALTRYR